LYGAIVLVRHCLSYVIETILTELSCRPNASKRTRTIS